MKIFNLPDLGEGLPDAEINQWHVQVGDEVAQDQIMVSMETAKAVVDVPAPVKGKIVKLYGQPGDVIATGTALVAFETVEEIIKPHQAVTVAGSLEVGETLLVESAFGISSEPDKATVKALPSVRMLARRLGVKLDTLTGSGVNGQITANDVEQASKIVPLAEGYQALTGVRRSMAQTMVFSHQQVVPVSIYDEADIEAWPSDADITLRIIRALQQACATEPSLNAWYESKTLSRRLFTEVNIGLAMDASEGLFVPVLKDVAMKTDAEIRAEIDSFKQQVQQRTIQAHDLQGATILLSNFGRFAGRYASPIIVPPTVAIVAVGKLREQVVAVNGQVAVHTILPLSLSFDHRSITGGEATRFLGALVASLSQASC